MSGCRDNQYSYDARIDGTYHGAMTYYALQIDRRGATRTRLQELWDTPRRAARDRGGYDQEPQLEGKSANKRRRLFT